MKQARADSGASWRGESPCPIWVLGGNQRQRLGLCGQRPTTGGEAPACPCWPGWPSQVALWVGLRQVRRPLPDRTRLLPPLSHIHHPEKVWPGLPVPRDCPQDCGGSCCPRQPGLGQDRPWGNGPLWVWSACGQNKDQETASENTGWGGAESAVTVGPCGASAINPV